jgi:hypothetical protein
MRRSPSPPDVMDVAAQSSSIMSIVFADSISINKKRIASNCVPHYRLDHHYTGLSYRANNTSRSRAASSCSGNMDYLRPRAGTESDKRASTAATLHFGVLRTSVRLAHCVPHRTPSELTTPLAVWPLTQFDARRRQVRSTSIPHALL